MGWHLPPIVGRYFGGIGRAVSQLGSAIIGRSPGRTLSGQIGEAVDKQGVGPAIAREVDSLLDKLDPGHSKGAFDHEERLRKDQKCEPGAFEKR